MKQETKRIIIPNLAPIFVYRAKKNRYATLFFLGCPCRLTAVLVLPR